MKYLIAMTLFVMAAAASSPAWAGSFTLTTTPQQDAALDAQADREGRSVADILQSYYDNFIQQYVDNANKAAACADAGTRAAAKAAAGVDLCR